jgi:hypothetical protein
MAKRALMEAGASVQVVWMPGHTESCWLNFTADRMGGGQGRSDGGERTGG